ncbi:MAG: hypothetical protein LQ345_005839 [Seirophora villosa]|nr:MAG: hypothetical protein LQ345_005839 [Seirophora villosa]
MPVHQDRPVRLLPRWPRRPQGGGISRKQSTDRSLLFKQCLTSGPTAVIFGDPQNGQAVANVPAARLKQYCARGDGVCSTPRTFRITSAHLSYGNNADDAADFVIAATGV